MRRESPQVDSKVLAGDCVLRSGQPSHSGSEEVYRRRFARAAVAVLVKTTALRHKRVVVRLTRHEPGGSKGARIWPELRITIGGEKIKDHPITAPKTDTVPFHIACGGPADHGEKRRSAAHFLGEGESGLLVTSRCVVENLDIVRDQLC